jgi:uncharacterized SAM-binding protein YcdF (DUF218 family)
MLYVIKWLYAWVMPPALFLLVGLATVLLFCKTKKKYWLIWLPVLLYGLSIGPVSDRLIKPLEDQYEQPELTSLRDAQAIVVLGGGSYRGVRDFDGEGQISADAANRLFMGLRLHKALHLPMILSGGQVFSYSATEADIEYRLLKAGGVEEKFLIKEANSRNTVENARFTGKLCQQHRFDKVILVTSAYHMPRSVMLFEREGVHVVPYPTDYKTDKETVINAFTFVPGIGSLLNTTTALKEYLGIAAVKAGLQ